MLQVFHGGWVGMCPAYLGISYKINLGYSQPPSPCLFPLPQGWCSGNSWFTEDVEEGPVPTTDIFSSPVKGGLEDICGRIYYIKSPTPCKLFVEAAPGKTVGGLGTVPEKLFHPISDSDTSCPGWNQVLPRQLQRRKWRKTQLFRSQLLQFKWEFTKWLSLDKDWGSCVEKATWLPHTTSESIPSAKTPRGQTHPLWLGGSVEQNDLGVGYTWTPQILLGVHLVDNTNTARLERSEI